MVAEFALALVVTGLGTPLIRDALARHGVLDVPNARSSHTVPIPRGGGVACSLGVLAGLLLAYATTTAPPWPAALGVLALAAIGFQDDRHGLPANLRLLLQVAAGAMVGATIGGPWWSLFGVVCLPIAVNVVNFMDGIDGITTLTVGGWGVVATALGIAGDADALVVVGSVTAGAALGFLPWNAPRARVFLGDSGSYLFGALVGTGVILGLRAGVPAPILVAPLSVYLADTGSALIKRALRGESLMAAHREHAYQRLVAEAQLAHVTVAVLTVALSLLVTVAWWAGGPVTGSIVTIVVAAAYVISPDALRRLREGQVNGAA